MKKLIGLLLTMVILVGCSVIDPSEKYYGTWLAWGMEQDGSVLTAEEMDAFGVHLLSDFYIVIKEGGTAFIQCEQMGLSDTFEWTSSNDKIKIGYAECEIDGDGKLVVGFPGGNVMFEKISKSQNFADIAITHPGDEATELIPQHTSGGIRPEFKKTMDDYEAFFDSYADFMQRFSDTDNVLSMMTDYLDFLDKYQEAMDSMDELENSDLSDEELKYYTEVTLRIEQKLLSVI